MHPLDTPDRSPILGAMTESEVRKIFDEGNRLSKEGKHQEAGESYDKALAIDPKHTSAWMTWESTRRR